MTPAKNPHAQAQDPVTLTVTQEDLYVLRLGVERVADLEDGEFAHIRDVAGNMVLPQSVVTYAHMKA